MHYRAICKSDDAVLAEIVRKSLKENGLDLPGTVYFDANLDRLSDFYLGDAEKRYYFIAEENGKVVGGVGLAEFRFFDSCTELQKLYLTDQAKGRGLGYELMTMAEEKARQLGYKKAYLETHTNLKAAIHIYEKCGYKEIEKPAGVVHASMNKFYLKEL